MGLSVGLASLAATSGQVSAEACPSTNDIMTGGASSPANFIQQVQGSDSSGHTDLAAIYAHFGLEAADYGSFASNAQQGVDMMDGSIMVDGQVVATNGFSFGRLQECQGSGAQSLTIGGTTIWGNVNSANFASDNQPVTVLFDKTGMPTFVVINSCGNPSKFTPVKPEFHCDLLEKHPVDGKPNTFTFTTQATATNNASIAKVVYDFGDGTTATLPDGTTPTPPHTFTQSTTVFVTVFVNVPGKQQVQVTATSCQLPINVTPPPTPPTPPTPTPPTPPAPKPMPTVLPNTGAGNVIGLFGATTAGGFLAYRRLLLRRHRSAASTEAAANREPAAVDNH